MLAVLTSLLTGGAYAVECGDPVSPAELEEVLVAAESEYIDLNEAGFRDRVNEAAGLFLPCISDRLDAKTVAHHHRVMSLHLLMVGDEAGSLKAVESAKIADPEYQFPDEILPANHPIRAHYDAYVPEFSGRTVPEPRVGSISFDGTNSRSRPKLHPTIAQLFDEQGLAQTTTYLAPRESLPPYRAVPRRRNTLIISSGSALVLSGAMYSMAWAQRGNLFSSASDLSTSVDTLNAKRSRTNGYTIASTAFLGIAVGTGVSAAMIGER